MPRPRVLEPNRSAQPTDGARASEPPEGPRGAPVAAAARRACYANDATTVDAAAEVSFAKAVHGEMKSGQEWAVGAGVMAACLAVPPTLFALADVISNAAA